MLPGEILEIGRTASGKMRAVDPELIEKLSEASLDRTVILGICANCHGGSPCFQLHYPGCGNRICRLPIARQPELLDIGV